MNSCTCEDERKRAKRLLHAWDDAKNEYRDALDELADLQIELSALKKRWIAIVCCIFPVISTICLKILLRIFELEDEIDEQEPIVKEKKNYRDRVKDYYDRAKERYIACKDSLKPCKGCENEFKPKPECIKTCRGCGYDYCDTCFDEGIEAWEMKQKEKENVE